MVVVIVAAAAVLVVVVIKISIKTYLSYHDFTVFYTNTVKH